MTADYQYLPRAVPESDVDYPLSVQYCGECTMPLEYCEFSQFSDKCHAWLEKNLPDTFQQLTTTDGDGNALANAEAPTKGRQVRGGKGTSRKKVNQKITLFKTSRGKKKFTTSIMGLSTFDIELKAASKFFGQKFATGSSVTGNDDEIMIQGDVKDGLIDLLTEKWPEIDENVIEDLGEMKR